MSLVRGLLLIMFLTQPVSAAVINVFDQRRGKTKEVKKKPKRLKRGKNYRKKFNLSNAENIALRKKLQDLKVSRLKLDFTNSLNIPRGTTFKGVLLNNVISSNLASPVVVKVRPNKYLAHEGRFHCTGKRENRRILVACDSISIDGKEYSGLRTSLLNLDGTNGLKGHYWSGEERYISGVMVSSLASGIVLASQDTTQTALGSTTLNNGKNAIVSGLASSAGAANQILTEKLKKSQGIVSLKAGSEVLVYFNGGYTQ